MTLTAGFPTNKEEQRLVAEGFQYIAGIDEAGRGALMGPVVAGAVVMPAKIHGKWKNMVRDSKLLTASQRAELFDCIVASAICWGVGYSSNDCIDANGIGKATRLAMVAAVKQLSPNPIILLSTIFGFLKL